MTYEHLAKLGRDAGLRVKMTGSGPIIHPEGMERFAEFVRAEEREACAKVLDDMADDMAREMEPSTAIAYVRSKAAEIRARGKA